MKNPRPRALVVFDLDGTLLRGPTVCEIFARSLNRLPRMQEFEWLKSQEDISAARREMALWYRDVSRVTLLRTLDEAQLAPGAAAGISLLLAHGAEVGIASLTWRFAVTHLAATFGVEHCLGAALDDSGSIEHVWPEHKAQWVLELANRLEIGVDRTAAVGDSAGDYDMLGVVGMPVFVGMELPAERTGWLHLPTANIEHVARRIIDALALQPNNALQATREDSRA